MDRSDLPGLDAEALEPANSSEFPAAVACADGSYVLDFDAVAKFHVRLSDKTITLFDVADDASSEGLTHLLFDHVAPRVLAEAEELVIHASAVEIEGKLAVFLGDTGAGKSTLAASLDQVGHKLIGDDAVLMSRSANRISGRSVYPSLRLYPEAIATVLGDDVDTAPMAHYSDKLRLDVELDETGTTEPMPIGAIFFLVDELAEGDVAVHPISPTLTCMGLIEHSFALDPNNAGHAARRLQNASSVARLVPGYELSYPWDFSLLPEVHEMVLSTMHAASQMHSDRNELGVAI